MPARRVHLLRLTARDETLARRGAFLLEDALRTASLPGGDGARLLIVRSLNLGRINGAWNPGSVALALEQRWRELGAGAVYAENPAAASQPAVYFRDRAEAVVLLALRLARGADLSAWFWPLAVAGWRPGLTGSSAWRQVLAAALALPEPVAALLNLLESLHAANALAPLLDALQPDDGPALLSACGWGGNESARTQAAPRSLRRDPDAQSAIGEFGQTWPTPSVPPGWRADLTSAMSRWGAGDARSLWFAAAILAIGAPGRLLGSGVVGQAARIVQALGSRPVADHSMPERPHVPAQSVNPAVGYEPSPAAGYASQRSMAPRGPHSVQPAIVHDRPDLQRAENTPTIVPAAVPAAPAETRHVQEAFEVSVPDGTSGADTARHTRCAGLFLLLPLLARLGIAGLLETNPHLAELDLPYRILRDCARRLHFPSTDPALAALRPVPRWTAHCPFLAPAAWQPTLATPGPHMIRSVIGRPGTHAIYDASGRLPLALWHGRAPNEVRQRLRDEALEHKEASLQRGSMLARRSDLSILLDAWAVAMRRWLVTYAGMALGELVRRPGFVAATRTHVDVFFAHRTVDIRIRRAGLDLDPGWLPWFGRVVLYHYVDELPF